MILHLFHFAEMDRLLFKCTSFTPYSSIGQLCEALNKIVGYGIYYDIFKIQNTKWLWFVDKFITIINSNRCCVVHLVCTLVM